MKIIKPADLIPETGKLISSSIDKLIIATIDFEFKSYPPLWEILLNQKKAGLKLFFYTANSFNNNHLSDSLQLKEPLLIPNLNFNLVMNDHHAMISTHHFGSSGNGSLGVSLLSETQEEYQEIFAYYVEYLHENASQPSSYYLLPENTLKESVLLQELIPNGNYKEVNMIKNYYPLSTFISQLGYLYDGEKIGSWLYFNRDGIVEKIEKYIGERVEQENISWNETTDKRHLLYSFVNLIGGIYQVPISKANWQAQLDDLIGNRNRNVFFDHIQQKFNIKFPLCAIHSLSELVNISHEQLIRQKGKTKWMKLLQKN
ncbi:MAG: hypothetical protein ACOCXH_15515 [Cyclobacteriaceae bacterium]